MVASSLTSPALAKSATAASSHATGDLGYRHYVGLELRPKATELAAAIAVKQADAW